VKPEFTEEQKKERWREKWR